MKRGAILILFTNLKAIGGLYNDSRLIVDSVINIRLLKVRVAGSNDGASVLIPRIALQTAEGDFHFVWER